MAGSRRQPDTNAMLRVTTPDQRQEAKNKTQASKKPHTKFNTGFNIEAVFGAISQLLETFTSQVLSYNSVNMSLLLRTIYRNLDDDLVSMLAEPKNVEALNKYMAERNQQILEASTTTSDSTIVQEGLPSGESSGSIQPKIEIKQGERQEGEITTSLSTSEKEEELPPEVVEQEPEIIETPATEVEGETKISEKKAEKAESKKVDLSQFTTTQKLCALGDADEDDIDIVETARDFLSELMSDAWKLRSTVKGIRVQQDDLYEEFQNDIDEDDEDDWEWNLYRYMYNREREVSEERKEKIEELVKARIAKGKEKGKTKPPVDSIVGRRAAIGRGKSSIIPSKPTKESAGLLQQIKKSIVDKTFIKQFISEKPEDKEIKKKSLRSKKERLVPTATKEKIKPSQSKRQQLKQKLKGENLPKTVISDKTPVDSISSKIEAPVDEKTLSSGSKLLKSPEKIISDQKAVVDIVQPQTDKTSVLSKATEGTNIVAKSKKKPEKVESKEKETETKEKIDKGPDIKSKPLPIKERFKRHIAFLVKRALPFKKPSAKQQKKQVTNQFENTSVRTVIIYNHNYFVKNRIYTVVDKNNWRKIAKFWQGEAEFFDKLALEWEDSSKYWKKRYDKLQRDYIKLVKELGGKPNKKQKKQKKASKGKKKKSKKPVDKIKVALNIETVNVSLKSVAFKKKQFDIQLTPSKKIAKEKQDESAEKKATKEKSVQIVQEVPKKTIGDVFKGLTDKVFKRTEQPQIEQQADLPPTVEKDIEQLHERIGSLTKDRNDWVDKSFWWRNQYLILNAQMKRMNAQKQPPQKEPPVEAKQPEIAPKPKFIDRLTNVIANIKERTKQSVTQEKQEPSEKEIEKPKQGIAAEPKIKSISEKVNLPKISSPSPKRSSSKKRDLIVPIGGAIAAASVATIAATRTKKIKTSDVPSTKRDKVKAPAKGKTKTIADKAMKVAPARSSKSKGMVSIKREQLDQIKSLKSGQDAQNKQAEAQPKGGLPKVPKPKPASAPIGKLTAASQMSDEEAFQKNVEAGSDYLNATLFNGKSITLPNNRIGKSLARILNATGKVAQKTEDDLDNVEKQMDNAGKGSLLKRIIKGLITVAVVLFASAMIFGGIKNMLSKWIPAGKDGKMTHGPKIFGIRLPNFGDMIRIGKGIFYMVKNGIDHAMLAAKKLFKKETWVKAWNGIKWIGTFLAGYGAGWLANKVLGWVVTSLCGVPAPISGYIVQIAGAAVTVAIEMIKDLFKFGKVLVKYSPVGLFLSWRKRRKEQRAKERKTYEEGATEKSFGNIKSAASKVKPLLPLEDILPKEMTAQGGKGNLPKVLIPDLGFVSHDRKTADRELDLSKDDPNVLAARKKVMDNASKQGAALDQRVMGNVKVNTTGLTPRQAEAKKRQVGQKSIIQLANSEIALLKKGRSRVKDNFVKQGWWSGKADVKDFIDKKTGNWNPKYVYAGENATVLLSQASATPFEPISGAPKYKIGQTYKNNDFGVMPFTFMIPSTGQKFMADIYEWERARIDTIISVWETVRNAAYAYGYGTPGYNAVVASQGKRWASISTYPTWHSRMDSARDMVDAWNAWHKKEEEAKKRKEARERRIKAFKAGLSKIKAGVGNLFKKSAVGRALKGIGSWAKKSIVGKAKKVAKVAKQAWGKITKAVPVLGKIGGWLSRKLGKDKKKEEAPKPPEVTYGVEYIDKMLVTSPWKEFKANKADKLMAALKIKSWFPNKPEIKDKKKNKVFLSGPGQILYNILTNLGFVFNEQAWSNPKFRKAMPGIASELVGSVNKYVNGILRSYYEHLEKLKKIGLEHKTEDYQKAIQEAAIKTYSDFDKRNNVKEYMKYVAEFWKPQGYHLIIRDKDGKIIKEEGKELAAMQIPENIYNSDPELWGKVLDGMQDPAPGEKAGWFKLRMARAKVTGGIKWIEKQNKVLKKQIKKAKLRTKVATKILTKSMAFAIGAKYKIKKQIRKAKKQIRAYFRKRSLMHKAATLGLKVAFAPYILAFKGAKAIGKGLKKAGKWFGGKMKGLFKKGKAKLKELKEKNIDALIQKAAQREKAIKEHFHALLDNFKTKGKKKIDSVLKNAKNVKGKFTKMFEKAKEGNLKLFGIFQKRQAKDAQIEVQTEAIAKEMVPSDDEIGRAKLKNVVRMAQERKEAAAAEKKSLGGYWADLRRKWQDRISEQSMKELKSTTLKLSTNIMDYMTLVREMPSGNATIVKQDIVPIPREMTLMKDIVF